jgi:gamma-glutamyl phosphate reductase
MVVVTTKLERRFVCPTRELLLVKVETIRRDVKEMQTALIGDKASLRVTVDAFATVLTNVYVHSHSAP